jgi:hypothetical protein
VGTEIQDGSYVAHTMLPQLSDTVLPADVPDGEVHIFVLDCLYVETYTEYELGSMVCMCGLTDCRYCCDHLSQSELVETTDKSEGYLEVGQYVHSRLPSRIEAEHNHAAFLAPVDCVKKFRNPHAHVIEGKNWCSCCSSRARAF